MQYEKGSLVEVIPAKTELPARFTGEVLGTSDYDGDVYVKFATGETMAMHPSEIRPMPER